MAPPTSGAPATPQASPKINQADQTSSGPSGEEIAPVDALMPIITDDGTFEALKAAFTAGPSNTLLDTPIPAAAEAAGESGSKDPMQTEPGSSRSDPEKLYLAPKYPRYDCHLCPYGQAVFEWRWDHDKHMALVHSAVSLVWHVKDLTPDKRLAVCRSCMNRTYETSWHTKKHLLKHMDYIEVAVVGQLDDWIESVVKKPKDVLKENKQKQTYISDDEYDPPRICVVDPLQTGKRSHSPGVLGSPSKKHKGKHAYTHGTITITPGSYRKGLAEEEQFSIDHEELCAQSIYIANRIQHDPRGQGGVVIFADPDVLELFIHFACSGPTALRKRTANADTVLMRTFDSMTYMEKLDRVLDLCIFAYQYCCPKFRKAVIEELEVEKLLNAPLITPDLRDRRRVFKLLDQLELTFIVMSQQACLEDPLWTAPADFAASNWKHFRPYFGLHGKGLKWSPFKTAILLSDKLRI